MSNKQEVDQYQEWCKTHIPFPEETIKAFDYYQLELDEFLYHEHKPLTEDIVSNQRGIFRRSYTATGIRLE